MLTVELGIDLVFADLLCSIESIEAAQRYVDSWPDRIRYEIPDSDPGDLWRFDSRRVSANSPDRNPELVVQIHPGILPLVTLRSSRLHTDKA